MVSKSLFACIYLMYGGNVIFSDLRAGSFVNECCVEIKASEDNGPCASTRISSEVCTS